jgi:hypothetical protein
MHASSDLNDKKLYSASVRPKELVFPNQPLRSDGLYHPLELRRKNQVSEGRIEIKVLRLAEGRPAGSFSLLIIFQRALFLPADCN